MTALEAIISALGAVVRFDPAFQARPEAIVWCDPERSFAPIISILRDRMPALLTLGAWDPATRSAPAFQLRIATSHAETERGSVPVLWLPGVGRETLRDAANCPLGLEPLAWLAAAGVFFGHVNGRDWTLRGFLTADRGPVKLDIADGAEAREALALAAPKLVVQEIESLRGRRFDTEALHAITAPDLADEVLGWMEGRRTAEAEPAWFKAFAQRASKNLGFDPRKRTRQEATRAMAERADSWAPIWSRYEASATDSFPATTAQLLREEPPGVFGEEETFPQANLAAEQALRDGLRDMVKLQQPEARTRLLSLERQHGHRRQTLWGRRGQAPLACALEHLVVIALAAPYPSGSPKQMAEFHVASGAAVDGAATLALASAPRPDDRAAVATALRATYLPWLDDGARGLQALTAKGAVPFGVIEAIPDPTDALVFIDGLRFDLGQRLVLKLRDAGANAALSWSWSGFPTSTASCKPLVSPVAASLTGIGGEAALIPMTVDGKPAEHRALMKAMVPLGYGAPPDAARVWIEMGAFDEDGHKLGIRLVDQLERGLEDAAQEILALARAGRKVRVVTDHGWLLMPGGLELAKLGVGLTEPDEKRSRYARLKEGATTQHAQAGWSWNPSVRLAMAPGASSFYGGQDYAHGGVSPQECVAPVIDIEPLATEVRAEIAEVNWLQMRLRVQTSGATDMTVDLRRADAMSGPSLAAKAVTVGEDGKASLMALDAHEDIAAMVVILDDQGRILARRSVTVGG